MKVLSVQEIAARFGVKPETVRWWKSQDPAFPAVVEVGRSWGLTEESVAAWELVKAVDAGGRRPSRGQGARPVWTPEKLEVLLRLVCLHRGVIARTKKDIAAGLGVHPSTVRRWMSRRGKWRSAPAAIPVARLEGFLRELGPSAEDLEREAFQAQNARRALARLKARRTPLEAWRDQGWLTEHRVWVEDQPNGLSIVRLTRVGTRRDHPQAGSESVRSLRVPNRFEAQLLKAAVLRGVAPWRVRLAGVSGGTECWISGAALRPLELLHDEARQVRPEEA